jgi:hypothetical protein
MVALRDCFFLKERAMQVNEKIAAMREYVATTLNVMFGEDNDVRTASSERIHRLAGLATLRRIMEEETPEDFFALLAEMAERNVHSGAGDEYKKAYQYYLSL